MNKRQVRFVLCAGAATCALLPAGAFAQQASPAELEARLRALEAVVATLQTQLETERARAAAQPVTLPPAAETRVAALETRVAAIPQEGFRVGAATVKLGGFVKAESLLTRFNDGPIPATVAGGTTSREFYVPGATPVGGRGDDAHLNAHAKQTRLTMTVSAPVPGHTLGAFVEGDFQTVAGTQGTQNVTNGYNFGLRRAYITFDKWLFGQDWTTFMNVATLPETTDFIGSTDGTVFGRQPMIRWTSKINDNLTFVAALENAETVTAGVGTLAVTGGQDDDIVPDAIVRFNVKAKLGDFVVAALLRRLSVEDVATGFDQEAFGWGLSASGKVPFGQNNRHDFRFMLTHGEGIGRYIGLGFAADALAINRPAALPTTRDLEPIGVTSGVGSLRFGLGPRTRMTVGGQFVMVDNTRGLTAGTANDEAWSAFVNLFFSPIRSLDLGVEYRRGERSVFNGQDGSMDRLHLVAKQSF